MENASTHLPLPEQITVNDEVVLRLLAENNAQELFRAVEENQAHLGTWLPWVSANRAVTDSLTFIRFVRAQFLTSSGLSLAIFVREELAAKAVAVDGGNNVIVTGYSYGSGSYYDYATIKYSSAGVPLWTNRYNGPVNADAVATALAVDGSNNVIVTGRSTLLLSYWDYTTIKYSSAGVPLWTNRYNEPGNDGDYPVAVAVDGSNNVIVTGLSVGSAGYSDYATIQYSSSGVPLWTNRYHGPWNVDDRAAALAVDGSNNVIVTGGASGSGSSEDYATIKYSSAGLPLWTNRGQRRPSPGSRIR